MSVWQKRVGWWSNEMGSTLLWQTLQCYNRIIMLWFSILSKFPLRFRKIRADLNLTSFEFALINKTSTDDHRRSRAVLEHRLPFTPSLAFLLEVPNPASKPLPLAPSSWFQLWAWRATARFPSSEAWDLSSMGSWRCTRCLQVGAWTELSASRSEPLDRRLDVRLGFLGSGLHYTECILRFVIQAHKWHGKNLSASRWAMNPNSFLIFENLGLLSKGVIPDRGRAQCLRCPPCRRHL